MKKDVILSAELLVAGIVKRVLKKCTIILNVLPTMDLIGLIR